MNTKGALSAEGATGFRSRVVVYLAAFIVLNVPFILFYPESPAVDAPLGRSLAVNFVLFLAPGLPLAAVLIRRGWLPRFDLFWVFALSFAVSVAVLIATRLAGLGPAPGVVWSATCAVTNLALGLAFLLGAPPWKIPPNAWIPMLLFVVAYPAYLYGATQMVPTTSDHDFEVQGTGYALLTRLKPGLDTSRNTDYYFAHPPLLHAYVAGSFLYYDKLDEIAIYDPEVRQTMPELENVRQFDQYVERPHWLETRTPNIFLGALTVALLGLWIAQLTGRGWFGVSVAAAYATTPDVFVRSSYGGYFSIGQFALLGMLVAIEARSSRNDRAATMACLVASAFAALADHKLILLPVAVVVWEWLRLGKSWTVPRAVRASLHPVVVGFAGGTAMFWAYGLLVSPSAFWMDHVRHHLVDRALNINARAMNLSRYPDVWTLWVEFWEHTGYLLLPLGTTALTLLCYGRFASPARPDHTGDAEGWRSTAGLWAIFAVVIVGAFSVVDWRQTKHLMPLILVLFLALARVAGAGRIPLIIVAVVMAALFAWNVQTLYSISDNPFVLMRKVPEW